MGSVRLDGAAGKNDKAAIEVGKIKAKDFAIAFSQCEDNILKSYSQVTYRWTMAPLSPAELANLSAGNDIQPQQVVICSGGGLGDRRASTFYGTPEYFIDNVEINTLATSTKQSGLSGNLTLNFDVIEPYSLGLFIQSLQAAAIRSSYNNYLDCTWLMRLEFFGTNKQGKQEPITVATRNYTQKLLQILFVSNEAGSKYQVRTLDFNLEAFNNIHGTYRGSATLPGASTVIEALTQLATLLNKDQEEAASNNTIEIADRYKIIVERDTGDKIKKSKFASDESSEKVQGTNKGQQQGDTKDRSKPVDGARSFTFLAQTKGRRITDMIQEIMISSEYCTNAIKQETIKNSEGYVTWYRISVSTKYKDDDSKLDKIQNRPAYDITFVITPYTVHHSVMKTPLGPSVGFKEILNSIKKQYSYIYTGLNDDIVRWELKFDNTFYTAIPSKPAFSPRETSADVYDSPSLVQQVPADLSFANTITHHGRLYRDTDGSYRKPVGGGTHDGPDIRAARAFEQATLLDTEAITLQMTILGDPYYLTKSGAFLEKIGPEFPGAQINTDKTMATESGEVRLYLRFRTPLDAPKPGEALFIFPSSGYTDSPFSGLYKIKSVKSKFHEGVFTQDLDLFRDRGQQPQEIANVRADPSLIAGNALITDPRQRAFSSVVAPAAAAPAAAAPVASSSPVKPQSSELALQPASLAKNPPPKATLDPIEEILEKRFTGPAPD